MPGRTKDRLDRHFQTRPHLLTTPSTLLRLRAGEDSQGPVDAQPRHPGRGLLLLKEGLGCEVGPLGQVVGVGASKGGASDDFLYEISLVRSPSSHASYRLGTGLRFPSLPYRRTTILSSLVEDEKGVAVRRGDRPADAVKRRSLGALDVGRAEADFEDLNAADGPGSVLDDAQAVPEDLRPLFRGSLRSVPSMRASLPGLPAGHRREGSDPGDGLALLQLEPLVGMRPDRSFHRSASTPRADRT